MTAASPLARVRALTVAGEALTEEDMTQYLRAAPQLREFTFNVCRSRSYVPEFICAAKPGLMHSKLRSITVAVDGRLGDPDVPADCGVWLRHFNFPRLRQLVVYGETYSLEDPKE
jgi:hypothetical protein